MTLARFSGVVLALGLLACSSDPEVTQGKSKSLVLLYTSDEHSQLFAISPELDDYPLATTEGSGELVGGVARRAALFESERSAAQAAGKSVLTVSAGDNTMGTLAVVGFRSDGIDYGTMVKLGYDVTTRDFRVAINTLLIFLVAFQVFVIGMLADLIGRATRATHEVQPAAGYTRDVPPTFPAGHRSRADEREPVAP